MAVVVWWWCGVNGGVRCGGGVQCGGGLWCGGGVQCGGGVRCGGGGGSSSTEASSLFNTG